MRRGAGGWLWREQLRSSSRAGHQKAVNQSSSPPAARPYHAVGSAMEMPRRLRPLTPASSSPYRPLLSLRDAQIVSAEGSKVIRPMKLSGRLPKHPSSRAARFPVPGPVICGNIRCRRCVHPVSYIDADPRPPRKANSPTSIYHKFGVVLVVPWKYVWVINEHALCFP